MEGHVAHSEEICSQKGHMEGHMVHFGEICSQKGRMKGHIDFEVSAAGAPELKSAK